MKREKYSVDNRGKRWSITNVFGLAIIGGALCAPSMGSPSSPNSVRASTPAVRQALQTEVALQSWRKAILKTSQPKKACFVAMYPEAVWHEVGCKTPPNRPLPPKLGMGAEQVGGANGEEYSAQVQGHISTAEGSFESVGGVTSEIADGFANQFSLQLNTNYFTTTACRSSPSPSTCQGWQQFVYDTDGSGFIQYWLLKYGPEGTSCPAGWNSYVFQNSTEVYCWINAASGASAPLETIASIGKMTVGGAVPGVNGASDFMVVTVGGLMYSAPGDNRFPDLGSQWQAAEYNVFGDTGGDQAVFNVGTVIVVKTQVDNGTINAPTCLNKGFTGESNNLSLVGPCCPIGGFYPSIAFRESNQVATPPSCAGIQQTDLNCPAISKLIKSLQAQLVTAQNRLTSPTCEGPASFECVATIRNIQSQIETNSRLYSEDCR